MESDYIDSGNTFLFYFGASQYTCEKARWDFNTSICFSMCCLIWSMAPWLHFEWIDASLNVFLLLCTVSHSSYFNGYVKTFPKRISLLFKFQIVSLENGSNNFPFPVFLLADCSYVSAVLTTRWFFSLQSNSIFFFYMHYSFSFPHSNGMAQFLYTCDSNFSLFVWLNFRKELNWNSYSSIWVLLIPLYYQDF